MDPIYHLAVRSEWEDAIRDGAYRRSTLGSSLDEVGFIHCSFAGQVDGTANRFYQGRSDVVLLKIDPARLPDEVRVEAVEGSQQAFPHLYGPLPVGAVTRVAVVPLDADGRLGVEAALESGA